MFGADLNPLITSTYAAVAPDPDTVVDCASAGIDTDVGGTAGAAAADALLAFPRLRPTTRADGERLHRVHHCQKTATVYAIVIDDRLITHITVANTPEGWTVTKVKAPGC